MRKLIELFLCVSLFPVFVLIGAVGGARSWGQALLEVLNDQEDRND